MVSSKCSGRAREKDSDNLDVACTRAKAKDSGSAATTSSRSRIATEKTIVIKRSNSSGSAGTGSPNFRGSSEGGPQTRSSSALGTRKSQRLEKSMPSASPTKNESEKVPLESPLRKSERIEKRSCSTSSSSRTPGNLDRKQSPDSRDNGKQDISGGSISKKRKPCDARTFRALFTPANKKAVHRDDVQADRNEDTTVEGDTSNVNKVVDVCSDGSRGKDSSHTAKRSGGQGSITEQRSDGNQKAVEKGGTKDTENADPGCLKNKKDFPFDGISNLEKSNKVTSNCEGEDIRVESGEMSCTEKVTLIKMEIGILEGIRCKSFGGSVVSTPEVKQVPPSVDTNDFHALEEEKIGETCCEEQHRSNGGGVKIVESASQDGSAKTCSLNTYVFKGEQDNMDRDQETRGQSTSQRDDAMEANLHDHVDVSFATEEDRREIPTSEDVVGETDGTDKAESFPHDNETMTDNNVCIICKLPGKLLCCDGKDCKRIYHLSCLDPPLKEVPSGLWHCLYCVRKKLVSGVYSVCEGIEAILDVNSDELSCSTDTQKEKQYLVKYEGLSHIHNRWIPESQLIYEAPTLFMKFQTSYQKEKITKWKKEWSLPHRLLGKRLIMPPKLADECFQQYAAAEPCYYEWLVKWTGLSYEQATWELENSPFFASHDFLKLIENYERHRVEAKELANAFKAIEVQDLRKKPFCMLSALPAGSPDGLDPGYLSYVNRLREFLYKEENAVLANEQDPIIKAVLLISSLLADICRPILVISTLDSLHLWETELTRLIPSANIVVYNGSRDERKLIHKFEFYEEGGCILFRVLLSHVDVVMEDCQVLDCIAWKAIIIDNCQLPKVSKSLEQCKILPTDWRLLLLNGPIKDNIPQYLNLLSILNSGRKESSTNVAAVGISNQASDLSVLKEQLAKYYVKECKQDLPRFVEFWVPVQLSSVQLEHYCAALDSGSMILRSSSKVDPVGALRELVLSARKCCDHPYLVDASLQGLLTKCVPTTEIIDVGVNASGKLRLLDRILQDMQSKELRAVVMFQFVGGEGKISIGDILDDYLRIRFGADAYERVDGGLVMAKKQAALQNFNNKERGRFVFLIENRACLPSIKLSSVDAIIIYGSDWNPLNDIKALQKISIKSHREQLKVFRLYSVFTVEEMVLSLAKQNVILESNIPNITPVVSHSLLRWGANHLFQKLDEFHKCDSHSTICVKSVFDKPVLHEVLLDLKSTLGDGSYKCTNISEVQSGTTYTSSILLFGENELKATDDDAPHVFWSKLLDGRPRQWRYLTSLSQRVRRKAPCIDEPHMHNKEDIDEAKRKSKKTCSLSETVASRPGLHSERQESGALRDINDASQKHMVAETGTMAKAENVDHGAGKARKSQKSLFLVLKPELTELCEVLGLSEDVKGVAVILLEYVMENHHVSQEQQTLLQAFKISLCWRAASLLKCKMDHKESLALARTRLNYNCKDDEAESVYTKLRMLKKKFSHLGHMETNPVASHSAACSVHDNYATTAIDTCSMQTATNVQPTLTGNIPARLASNTNLLEEPSVTDSRDGNDGSNHPQMSRIDIHKFKESSPVHQGSNSESETTKTSLHDGLNCSPSDNLADAASSLQHSGCTLVIPEANGGSIEGSGVRSCPCSSAGQILHVPSVIDIDTALVEPVPDLTGNPQLSHLGDSLASLQSGISSLEHVASTSPQPVDVSLTDCERPIVLQETCQDALQIGESDIILSLTDPNPDQLQYSAVDVLHTDNMEINGLGLTASRSSVVPIQQATDASCIESSCGIGACSDVGPQVTSCSTLGSSANCQNNAINPLENVHASLTETRDCTQYVGTSSQDTSVPATQDTVFLENNATFSLARSLCSRLPQPIQVHARLPTQELRPDPFQNELLRISKEKDSIAQLYNELNLKLMSEYELELEKLRKKYEASIHEVELHFSEKVSVLDVIYKKVDINRILAEEFRSRFTENRGATARPATLQVPSQLRPQLNSSHDQLPQGTFPIPSASIAPIGVSPMIAQPLTSADVSSSNSFSGSIVNPDDASTCCPTQSMVVPLAPTSSMSHQVVHQPSALFSTPSSRPYVNSKIPTYSASSTHRMPAPHLHSLRPAAMRVSSGAFQHSQASSLQQIPVNSGASTFMPLHTSAPVSSPLSQNHAVNIQQHESTVSADDVGLHRDDIVQTAASSLAGIEHGSNQTGVSNMPTILPQQGQLSVSSSDVLLEGGSSSPVVMTENVHSDESCQPCGE